MRPDERGQDVKLNRDVLEVTAGCLWGQRDPPHPHWSKGFFFFLTDLDGGTSEAPVGLVLTSWCLVSGGPGYWAVAKEKLSS